MVVVLLLLALSPTGVSGVDAVTILDACAGALPQHSRSLLVLWPGRFARTPERTVVSIWRLFFIGGLICCSGVLVLERAVKWLRRR